MLSMSEATLCGSEVLTAMELAARLEHAWSLHFGMSAFAADCWAVARARSQAADMVPHMAAPPDTLVARRTARNAEFAGSAFAEERHTRHCDQRMVLLVEEADSPLAPAA